MALKILLADDNITAQRLGAKILTDAGHEVVAVSNGAAAVKKIASEHPELLILDVYMPGYSGLEVCAKVKAAPETAQVPVLLSVTSMEPFSPEEGNRARADGVMIKPFIASDLLAVIEKLERKLHPPAPPEPEPQDTVKLPAVEEFQDASYEEWKAESAPEEEPQAAPMAMTQEMAVAPVLGIEEMPVTPPPAAEASAAETSAPEAVMPAFGEVPAAQPAFGAPPESSQPAMPSGFEFAPEPLLEHTRVPAEPAGEIALAPEVEFTAAPQVGEIEVAPAPELELTIEPPAEETVIAQDPALVTTPEEMAQFKTSFGVENAEEIPVGIATPEPAPEPPGEVASDDILVLDAEPAAEPGVETVRMQALEDVLVEVQPPAPAAVETVAMEPLEVVVEEPTVEAVMPEPEPQKAEEPQAIEVEVAEEPPAFSVSASGAAVAPAREPELAVETPAVETAAAETPAQHDELVAQFAAELEQVAQAQPEPEPQAAPPAYEAEPPAAAAMPAPATADEERLVAGVSAVLDRYLAGLKQEMIAAIVRELKK